ncbi:MAG: acylphosphatase [Deltaproteobacteria bacterium]|nr:acylphosphatase [Deltaproteobacteria bacterium]
MEAIRVVVTGRVQGVSYRAYCQDAGRRMGLTGWVRNRRDGSVEAFAQGERAALDAFTGWCHQGSPSADVTGVTVERVPPDPAVVGFSVRSTA